MSGLVESSAAREGAWRWLVLRGPRGNLLSLELVRELGAAIHVLESQRGITWLTIEGSGGELSYGARIQEQVPEMMATVLAEVRLAAFPSAAAALLPTPPKA